VAHHAGAYPGFCSIKRLGILLLPLDGMLVHRRVTPSIKFAGTHLYTWVESGTVRVKCLAQEHNELFPVRARTWTARSGVVFTNHEATAPLTASSDCTRPKIDLPSPAFPRQTKRQNLLRYKTVYKTVHTKHTFQSLLIYKFYIYSLEGKFHYIVDSLLLVTFSCL